MTKKDYLGLQCAHDLAVIYAKDSECGEEIISTLNHLIDAVDELRRESEYWKVRAISQNNQSISYNLSTEIKR